MGYEIRLVVVEEHYRDADPNTGTELAMIELGKCGEGPVYDLVQSRIKKKGDGDPPFALWPRTPDRQEEAVELLRELAETPDALANLACPGDVGTLANDIESGYITSDPYGYYLGVFTLDEMITALVADTERTENRFSVIALAMLNAFKNTMPKNKRLRVVSYSH